MIQFPPTIYTTQFNSPRIHYFSDFYLSPFPVFVNKQSKFPISHPAMTIEQQNSKNLKFFKLGFHYFITHFFILCLISLMALAFTSPNEVHRIWLSFHYKSFNLMTSVGILIFGSIFYILTRPKPVYLVDYSCYRPPSRHNMCLKAAMDQVGRIWLDDSSVAFQGKILDRSGLGDETSMPPALSVVPPRPSLTAARDESEEVIFASLDNLFTNASINPSEIGILIVNCSVFNPTPSLTDIIINKYRLRTDIKNYNLSGMGCSAGLISMDLAKRLLQVHKNSYALVISTENITHCGYFGIKKSMLVANCLFRMGGAAILLSNKSAEKRRAKYKLLYLVRTHKGTDDNAFKCVYQEQDEQGKTGVSLSRDLMVVAGEALKTNITTLGPLVLPMSEQLLFFITLVCKKLLHFNIRSYIPDFKTAFAHFCIHAGGRAVIDELERNLKLSPLHVEASRMTLHRFGNTSSSSIWYELAYIEAKGRMRKGNRAWQIAIGSGFKCNSAIWEALCDVKPSINGAWEDCIRRYPVKLPE